MFKENPDFFPTPTQLINKMTSKIDWKTVQTVLEPSAGKGDLVEAVRKQFDYTKAYRRNNFDVDLIEYDENLRHVLKGKNYRVVADDFLTYQTYKQYDLIFMNPPYSQGDKHLLQAITMMEAQQKPGQVLSLLNAETLKNPYSNTRKELIRKLEENNAEVEFIQNAFSNAERKTDVETAIIYIKFEKSHNNSVILDELKQEETYKAKNEYNSDKLIESDFIRGIVQQYNYEVKAGLKLIEEYNSLVPYMLGSFKDNSSPILKLDLSYRDEDGSSLENAYIKQIRLKYWKALFNNDQFMGLFTSNLKAKYMQQVEELKDYDFSFYNIYTIRIELNKEMIQGVEDTILNLFEEFSHKHHYYDEQSKNILHFNGWKTNKAYKINKKVIIPLNGFYDMQYSWGRYNPTKWEVKDKLKDIEKVFNYLDNGRSEDIDLEQALKMAEHYGETKKIELKYFYVTFYKKGTTHIEFRDMELLKKFNLFGSQKKGFLPPSYGKASYNDMTREEREVIDNFEGEKSYNDVMRNKNYYIVQTEEFLRLTS
ncbi:DNA N-6-adenine-methyltransferase [Bacillus sp. UMB0728]|uniref:DNA N-6-adenine-methyltransferase n=1 Tax=Bacillus sp. UMB0728 TaxID=2066052 RepID=UPI000C76CF3E|nr:DNA N-6-adenine-methyltransferase [Bacillus sp. UMB0728]PLR72277.1 DNA methyltransferase [Bacillus sp. UMB0728]